MDSSPIVALEIGTSKVKALVALARDDDHLRVIGLGECPARGVRKSEIVDFDNALSCVRMALQNAEESSNVAIRQVFVLISGNHLQATVNRGNIPLLRENGQITREDMEHVMETARAISLPTEREVIHTICQQYYVDDQRGVVNPAGLEGSRLAVDMLILHGVRTRLRSMVRVAKSVPVDVQDVAFTGLCSALSLLAPEEKENGALVIDLGGGTTSYLAYAGGAIAAAGCLGVGGDHITNDLARGLRIALPQAEGLKESHGSAIVDVAARNQRVDLGGESTAARRTVRQGDVQLISSLRAEEILSMVKAQFENSELLHHLGTGVVLAGGGAYLKNMTGLAEKVFGLPCQIGRPRDISGLALSGQGVEYAACLGMLRYAMRTSLREPESAGIGSMLKRMLGLGGNW